MGVVGCATTRAPAYGVARLLQRHGKRIVPVHQQAQDVHGERATPGWRTSRSPWTSSTCSSAPAGRRGRRRGGRDRREGRLVPARGHGRGGRRAGAAAGLDDGHGPPARPSSGRHLPRADQAGEPSASSGATCSSTAGWVDVLHVPARHPGQPQLPRARRPSRRRVGLALLERHGVVGVAMNAARPRPRRARAPAGEASATASGLLRRTPDQAAAPARCGGRAPDRNGPERRRAAAGAARRPRRTTASLEPEVGREGRAAARQVRHVASEPGRGPS